MDDIKVSKHYKIKDPKNERVNLKLSKADLKSLDQLSEKRNMNRSELIRTLLNNENNKYTRSFSTYKCDECGKKIKLGAEYYAEVGSVEKQIKEGNKLVIEVLEGKDLGILCYPCAQKLKAIDYIKTGDPTYPVNQTNRTVWGK